MDFLWRDTNIFYKILCFLITENEKLFDKSDAKLYWRTVFHILSIVHHFWIAIFAKNVDVISHSSLKVRDLYTFRFGYFTGWNFGFQTVFLCLALIYDMLEWLEKHESRFANNVRYWRDVVFCGLVVPFTLFVSGMFWSVYAIDRELVFPKVYDTIIPTWFNHCVHTNISVVVVVETLLQPRRHATNRSLELILSNSVSVLYAAVYYCIFFFAGRWLYPLFGIMTWWQVCVFQCCIWFAIYIFYEIQFPINRLIHGAEPRKPFVELEEMQNVSEVASQKNGIQKNGVQSNVIERQSLQNSNPDLKTPPFSTKSWSLKYRSIREQFETSRL
ncbi:androgen-dependent TFPI-regulating protein-like [Galleria mellonella]|uniref:Androgen-dependent TFPI-regulating protein-like n=1 Tax=Galleria mellonella TaxID=7137 RepID=A0ABM3MSG6_GALME|nr:androgen-dependent TFPI-regulating protein-like [Galleria mellonella]